MLADLPLSTLVLHTDAKQDQGCAESQRGITSARRGSFIRHELNPENFRRPRGQPEPVSTARQGLVRRMPPPV